MYSFVRSRQLNVSYTNALEIFGVITFALTDLPDYTEFTALFDLYRLRKVVLTFRPAFNNATAGTAASAPITYNYTVIDYDDANALASDGIAQEYQTCQVHTNYEKFTRVVYPRLASAVYSGAFTSFASTGNTQWLDAASPGVLYYGLKYNIEPSLQGTTTPVWYIDMKYYIELKNVR